MMHHYKNETDNTKDNVIDTVNMKTKLFNVNVIVDYRESTYSETNQDELYREQLLNVFYEKQFDSNTLVYKIETLHNKLTQLHFFNEMCKELNELNMKFTNIPYRRENDNDNDDVMSFIYLFSFETFQDIYQLIQQYLLKKNIVF